MAARKQSLARAVIETLEERQLLSWGSFPTLIGQDQALTRYPQASGKGVTIVDIDTGVNPNHPALQGRIWTNPGEIPGNGIDDDKDGLVDDVHGWNFVTNTSNTWDDQGHGTMTAGIMVANHFVNTGNSRGYAGDGKEYQGVASGATVIPLKVIDASLALNASRVDAALKWVIANYKRYNIAAVNMSLDVGYSGYQLIAGDLQTLWNDGVFVAAASGNGSNTNDAYAYPAAGSYAMSVGAVNADDSINSITSRGPALKILAPGNGVVYLSQGADYWRLGPATSSAAPWVTAAGAVLKQINPDLTPAQISAILRETGKNVYDPSTRLTFKRLQLDAAIAAAYATVPAPSPTPVPEPAPPPTPIYTGTGSTPFGSNRIDGSGVIQAEDFDNGGEGIGYHDTTAANEPGLYRSTGVDIEKNTDGGVAGYDVGWTKAGEWLNYTINVASSGIYDLGIRVASAGQGGTFHIEMDGRNVTGTMTVPQTGGWNSWLTLTHSGVSLSSGQHVMRLCFDTVGPSYDMANVNWIRLSASSVVSAPSTPPAAPDPTPIPASPVTLAANAATALSGITRTSKDLSGVDQGDWAEFAGVDFGSGLSSFTINIALASGFGGKQVQIRLGSPTGTVIGTLTTTATGSWGNYQPQSCAIQTTTGVQNIYLTFAGGYGVGNISSIRFS